MCELYSQVLRSVPKADPSDARRASYGDICATQTATNETGISSCLQEVVGDSGGVVEVSGYESRLARGAKLPQESPSERTMRSIIEQAGLSGQDQDSHIQLEHMKATPSPRMLEFDLDRSLPEYGGSEVNMKIGQGCLGLNKHRIMVRMVQRIPDTETLVMKHPGLPMDDISSVIL
jgi:hypothetical protein